MNTTEAIKAAKEALEEITSLSQDDSSTDWNCALKKCASALSTLSASAEQTDYEALEREHLGDPDKRTGIYAHKASAEQQPEVIERRIYKNSPEWKDYLSKRFADKASNSFEFDGHRWAYQHTSFDDSGDYDLLYRFADSAPPASQPTLSQAAYLVLTAVAEDANEPKHRRDAAREALKAQASQPVALTDERTIVDLAIKHRLRYPTNRALLAFVQALLSATSQPSEAEEELLSEYIDLVFQCARYERPSTDWIDAGKTFIRALRQQALSTQNEAEIRRKALEDVLDKALEIVLQARESIGAGGYGEQAQHERGIVGPYLDHIEDELRALAQQEQQAPAVQEDLHDAIMNLPCHPCCNDPHNEQVAYRKGHRDARHAAAELAAAPASHPAPAQTGEKK